MISREMTSVRSWCLGPLVSFLTGGTLFVFALAPLAASAGDPTADCAATKLKAAGKEAMGKLTCHAKAAKQVSDVDEVCLEKAETKFQGVFEKVEAKGGCLTTGDADAIGDRIDATVASVVVALPVTTPPSTLPAQRSCAGHVYACGDGIDNDGDGLVDAADPECLGPCDDDELTYHSSLPGVVSPPCVVDCFWDQDGGPGNDDCNWTHACDLHEVAPSYHPESANGATCQFNGATTVPGSGGTCSQAYQQQSASCRAVCGPLVPNGCDCFGCCELPNDSGSYVYVGSRDAFGQATCTAATVDNPSKCQPCLPVMGCFNPCGVCELCAGKTALPPGCPVQDCPAGAAPCGLPGQAACSDGSYCISGCCQATP